MRRVSSDLEDLEGADDLLPTDGALLPDERQRALLAEQVAALDQRRVGRGRHADRALIAVVLLQALLLFLGLLLGRVQGRRRRRWRRRNRGG